MPTIFSHPQICLSCVILLITMTIQSLAQEVSENTIDIEYETAVYDFSGDQKKVVLTGPIHIRTSSLTVKCDRAEILSSRSKEKTTNARSDSKLGSIDYILASGNVEIKQAENTAYAGEAHIHPAEKKLILEKNPRIEDKYGIVSGHRIVFLQGERKIHIESGESQKRSHIQINNVEEVGLLMGEETSSPND